jgi:Predicted hydrolases of the HAD superfamily
VYFVVLAADYDETLASRGRVDSATVMALERVKASGRKLLLVTGRELPDLLAACPELELFNLVVCENGALLYDPATRTETPLADPPRPRWSSILQK